MPATPVRSFRARVLNIGEIPASIVISENLPRRAGLPATPGRSFWPRVLNIGEIPAPIVISENLPRRAGLPATPGRSFRARVLNIRKIPAPVLISENLPRRAGFPLTPGRRLRARVLNIGEIPAPVLISENLPRRAGFPPTPGRAAKRFDWTPGGRELGAGSWGPAAGIEPAAGRQARSACLTTGLPGYGQGCCLRVVVLQHPKCTKKTPQNPKVWKETLIFRHMR